MTKSECIVDFVALFILAESEYHKSRLVSYQIFVVSGAQNERCRAGSKTVQGNVDEHKFG